MFDPDNRHTLAVPYWARPGIALFAKRADDNDPDDDLDPDEDPDDPDEDPDEELTDEELRAELKATRERLSKASNQSAKRRKLLRERSDELEAERNKRGGGKPKGKADDDAEEIDVEAIRTAAKAEGSKAALSTVKRVAIRAALKGAGISDDKTLKRAIGMIDADELDVDDDGEVDGLDDAIATLKDEVPAIFGTTRRRRSVTGQDDRDGDKDKTPKDDDASKRQGRALLGKG